MHCNISENQMIFCGHANYKYYKAKTSSIFCLVKLKRVYKMVDGPSSSEVCTRPTNKWNCKGHGSHTILALYYAIVASAGLFTMLWPSNGKKIISSSFLLFMAYMYTDNRLVLAVTTMHCHLLHIIGSSIIYTLL